MSGFAFRTCTTCGALTTDRCAKSHALCKCCSQELSVCEGCLKAAVLTPNQRRAYRDAVHNVYCAPAGKFAFFQRQLEMVVEDLAHAVRAGQVAA